MIQPKGRGRYTVDPIHRGPLFREIQYIVRGPQIYHEQKKKEKKKTNKNTL